MECKILSLNLGNTGLSRRKTTSTVQETATPDVDVVNNILWATQVITTLETQLT